MIKQGDSVVVKQEQLHLNSSTFRKGEVISVNGQNAKVLMEGDVSPRTVAVASIKSAESQFGDLSSRPNQAQVSNQIRRNN